MSHLLDASHDFSQVKLLFCLLDKEIFGETIVNGIISVSLGLLSWVKIMDWLSEVIIFSRLCNLRKLVLKNISFVLPLGLFIFWILVNQTLRWTIVVIILLIPSMSAIELKNTAMSGFF